MLLVYRHKKFSKEFKKLLRVVQEKFEQKIGIFVIDQYSVGFNNHGLKRKYNGCRSIDITGDYRAIYYINNSIAIFIHIGTHHQLYGK